MRKRGLDYATLDGPKRKKRTHAISEALSIETTMLARRFADYTLLIKTAGDDDEESFCCCIFEYSVFMSV